MGRALGQAARQGQRNILYRGVVINCVVLLGVEAQRLGLGGLENQSVVHVKILKAAVPIGQDGDPHKFELVQFPAVAGAGGLEPRALVIDEFIAEEYAWNFTLVDPTK